MAAQYKLLTILTLLLQGVTGLPVGITILALLSPREIGKRQEHTQRVSSLVLLTARDFRRIVLENTYRLIAAYKWKVSGDHE